MNSKDDCHSQNPARLRQREYGQTGVKLSIIGFGGIVVDGAKQQHANRVVAEAFERGVNYFDVSPTYGDAELKLGPALKPYRKKVFLACKTGQRRREGASQELNESLRRLHTDYLDLYQLHSITDVKDDVDAVFAKGGAMEVFLEARKQGRVYWPSGSDLPCEMEVCPAQESDIINHSPGIRVPGDEPFFGKSEHVTVVLTVGAQVYRECPAGRCYAARRSSTMGRCVCSAW